MRRPIITVVNPVGSRLASLNGLCFPLRMEGQKRYPLGFLVGVLFLYRSLHLFSYYVSKTSFVNDISTTLIEREMGEKSR